MEKNELIVKLFNLISRYNSVSKTPFVLRRNNSGKLHMQYEGVSGKIILVLLNDYSVESFRQYVISLEEQASFEKEQRKIDERISKQINSKLSRTELAILYGDQNSILNRLTDEEKAFLVRKGCNL